MWEQLWIAAALVLVVEGLLPALNPRGYRRMIQILGSKDDRAIRIIGIILMIIGTVLIYLLKS